MPEKKKLDRVSPSLEELLPAADARAAFYDASAALEAGDFVRRLRSRANLTQAELAGRLSMSQARVSAIEHGEGRDGPSYALLKRIMSACGMNWSIMEVLDGEGPLGVEKSPESDDAGWAIVGTIMNTDVVAPEITVQHLRQRISKPVRHVKAGQGMIKGQFVIRSHKAGEKGTIAFQEKFRSGKPVKTPGRAIVRGPSFKPSGK